MGPLLASLAGGEVGEKPPCPDGLALEVQIAAGARLGAETLSRIADPSALSCPACQGVLSEVRGTRILPYDLDAKSSDLIRRQRQVVARLEELGADATAAQILLDEFEVARELHREHLARLTSPPPPSGLTEG